MIQLQWQVLSKLKWLCPAVSLTIKSKSLVTAVVIVTTWSALHSTVTSAHCAMCHIIQLFWRPQFQFYLNTFRRSKTRTHSMQNNYDMKTFWKKYFTKCATDTPQNNNSTSAFVRCWNPVWTFCCYTVWSNTSHTDFILPQYLLSNQCCWPFWSSLLWTLKSKPSDQDSIHSISWRALFWIGKCVCDSDWSWWHKTYFLLMPSWTLGKKLPGTKSRELGGGVTRRGILFFWQKFTKKQSSLCSRWSIYLEDDLTQVHIVLLSSKVLWTDRHEIPAH